jgi:hypothetical protein
MCENNSKSFGFHLMSYRVSPSAKSPALFHRGHHVLVDASGAGQGRYCMAAVVVFDGVVQTMQSKPCLAGSSVLAERECIEWAFEQWPQATVWNDCIPAIEAVLLEQPALTGALFWPTPRMRKPFHDLAHLLSVKARGLVNAKTWDEIPASV